MSMSAYIDHVCGILDSLVVVGEVFNESKVILIVVDGLGPEYASFATSLKMKFDHSLTFVDLQSMLTDIDIDIDIVDSSNAISTPLIANVVACYDFSKLGVMVDAKLVPCQICNRKGHGAVNCYNRFNARRFPPSHNRKLVVVGISPRNGNNRDMVGSTNVVSRGDDRMSVWYPDSEASSHVTGNKNNLQSLDIYSCYTTITAANGE